ncbi:MAG TPA: hypothetical protein PKH33_16295 [bacterium]|nr:hypothetical protein [bacterium]
MKNLKWAKTSGMRAAFVSILLAAAAISGCSKYAPTPLSSIPKYRVIEINLKTASPVSSDYFYYIALDIGPTLSEEGPREILSGPDRAKNWEYYIRLYDGVFTEKIIFVPEDIDEEPDVFNHNSPRFELAEASGNSIKVILRTAGLIPDAENIKFNFVTGYYPIRDNDSPALDFLTQPLITFQTRLNNYTDNELNAFISTHQNEQHPSADIDEWSIEVYEK